MIYFDNAATTFPKPEGVIKNTFDFIATSCSNPGRSAHKMGIESSRVVYDCRQKIAKLFNIDEVMNIAFTKNCSEALNIGLFSNIDENDHIISSVFEHNSIIRVLEHLKKTKNIEVTYLKPNENMIITKEIVEKNIKENTKMIAICHSNNLIGTYNDIESIGDLARQKDIVFLVDAAQSAGKKSIDVKNMNIDILCAPGHKSLYGFSGTGFIYTGSRARIKPMLYGGTGSFSDEINQPDIMPDMLETGTLNMVGIKSLLEGINYINVMGIDNISKKENELTHYVLDSLKDIQDVILYTPDNKELSGIVSFNIKNVDSAYVSYELDNKYDIAVRGGIHCNPMGHKYLGTLESGFIRVSVGHFNNEEEADKLHKAIKRIIDENKR